MGLKLVLRSYGGDNDKGRPSFYSKDLVVASFVRAAAAVEAEVLFVNDGPIPAARLDVMERSGTVLQIPDGPVGMRGSYVYGLDLPHRLGWFADDIVAFVEDDYLLTGDAFSVLLDGASAMPDVSYFALTGSRPDDLTDPAQRRLHQVPRGWAPTLPDRQLGADSPGPAAGRQQVDPYPQRGQHVRGAGRTSPGGSGHFRAVHETVP